METSGASVSQFRSYRSAAICFSMYPSEVPCVRGTLQPLRNETIKGIVAIHRIPNAFHLAPQCNAKRHTGLSTIRLRGNNPDAGKTRYHHQSYSHAPTASTAKRSIVVIASRPKFPFHHKPRPNPHQLPSTDSGVPSSGYPLHTRISSSHTVPSGPLCLQQPGHQYHHLVGSWDVRFAE